MLTDDHRQAVSVSLPTWKANVGYEEGEDWVLSQMKTGYPRCVKSNADQYTANVIESSSASSFIEQLKLLQMPLSESTAFQWRKPTFSLHAALPSDVPDFCLIKYLPWERNRLE